MVNVALMVVNALKSVYDLVKVALMVVKTFETAMNPSLKAW